MTRSGCPGGQEEPHLRIVIDDEDARAIQLLACIVGVERLEVAVPREPAHAPNGHAATRTGSHRIPLASAACLHASSGQQDDCTVCILRNGFTAHERTITETGPE
jgi:hypothetical protein